LELAIQRRDDYRRRGYNVVPSSQFDNKRPVVPYAAFWETPIPDEVYGEHGLTGNFQVMTGRHWGLIVIDLDGREAIREWERWTADRGCPATWRSGHGNDGRHIWFSVDRDTTVDLSYRVVWGLWDETLRNGLGDWRNHKRIDFLGDHRLVSAPPSVHSKSGEPYRFLKGPKPSTSDRPAMAPAWVLSLPDARPARPVWEPPPRPEGGTACHLVGGKFVTFREVADAIPDKVALAREWGVRVVGGENSAGWHKARCIDREDRNPSAMVSTRGSYWESDWGRTTLDLFQLGVSLGHYADIYECKNDLAVKYGVVKPEKEKT
jgi:hypothetical protein